MQDRQNARLMGMKATGNGRRQSFAASVMPRMTNTYMLAGDKDPGEILASVKAGHLRHQFRRRPGGHHQRQIRLQLHRGLCRRRRQAGSADQGATLIGSGPECLTRVSMIGNDMKLDTASARAARTARACRLGVGQTPRCGWTAHRGRNRSLMPRYWFRQKQFGYGATPNTWQGWLFTVAGALLVSALAFGADFVAPDTERLLLIAVRPAGGADTVRSYHSCQNEGRMALEVGSDG